MRLTVDVAVVPARAVRLSGLDVNVKSGPITRMVTPVEWVRAGDELVPFT